MVCLRYDYEYEDEPSESNSNYYSQPSTYTQQPSAPDWNEMRELELDRLSNLEDLMGSSGLGRVDAVQQLRQRQAQAIRDSLKKDVRGESDISGEVCQRGPEEPRARVYLFMQSFNLQV